MSIDNSLRTRSSLERHRNVLTRPERVAQLQDQEQWDPDQSVLGLPKIAHRKVKTSKKKAETESTTTAAAAGSPEGPA